MSGIAGLQNSTRETYFRNHTVPQHIPTTLAGFTNRMMIIGDDGEARDSANCVEILQSLMPGKVVMEVEFAGRKAVAKCWSAEFQERLVCLMAKYGH